MIILTKKIETNIYVTNYETNFYVTPDEKIPIWFCKCKKFLTEAMFFGVD